MRDEIIEETKKVPADFNVEEQPAKHKISIFYLHLYQLLQHY